MAPHIYTQKASTSRLSAIGGRDSDTIADNGPDCRHYDE